MNTSNGHQIHLINNNTEKVFQQPRESNRKIENVPDEPTKDQI